MLELHGLWDSTGTLRRRVRSLSKEDREKFHPESIPSRALGFPGASYKEYKVGQAKFLDMSEQWNE